MVFTNAPKDLAGNPRQVGTIDLGAYEAFPYSVTYEKNGATGGDVPIEKMTYGQGYSVNVQNNSGNLVRTGHTFLGWNSQADGQGYDYAGRAIFIMGTVNPTFYAKWSPNTYLVTFESNGGSKVTEQPIVYNMQASEPAAPRKQGHTLAGWYEDMALTKEWNFTTDVVTEAITLYTKWTLNPTYAVTYDKNGATGGTEPQDNKAYEENDSVTVQGNSGQLIRTGHTFKGWNTQAGGQGTPYAENTIFKMGQANITLYAQWTSNPTYSVTYDKNGATGGTVPQDNKAYEENDSVTVQGNSDQLVRTGHTFKGWNTQADGKGAPYTDKATFKMGKTNVTIYAQWTANPPTTGGGGNTITPPVSNDNDYSPPVKVKIMLHTNGGTVIEPIEVSYNSRVNDLPVQTREGYRFAGWYQDEALTKLWAENTVVREKISLYAKWTALPVEQPNQSQEPQLPKPIEMFSDIDKKHWANEMIEELARQGSIQGYEDGTFRPNAPISRMHVAVLLTRAFPSEQVREETNFSDVAPTHTYYEAIRELQQAGIIDCTNGAFRPTENMTRAQLAKVLVGMLGLTPEGTSLFADADKEHWATGYISMLEREGIELGDNGEFHPNALVTRAQFVAFLYRIMQTEK